MIPIHGNVWFLRRKPTLKRIKAKLEATIKIIDEDTKHDDQLRWAKYPEASTIIKSANDLFLLAAVVDEGLDELLTKAAQYNNHKEGGN